MSNKVAVINLKPEEFKEIVHTLKHHITNGRLNRKEKVEYEPINEQETQKITIIHKYGSVDIELVPLQSIEEGIENEWGGYICEENTPNYQKITEYNAGELNMIIGNGKLLDWCIDNNIEYVDRQAVEDENNAEGIDRIAEAIANNPWNFSQQPQNYNEETLLRPPQPSNSSKEEQEPIKKTTQNNEKDFTLETALNKLLDYKRRAAQTTDMNERRKLAEEAALLMAQFMGDSSEEDD
ncbi:hypothetical protein EDI_065090 [Entamoeba dispar SAW760]|uniref:Uncharacterized protein n=1 Tax=Entamoeba dispar (strain ATCC PRA-260 / SAW760) TaxID=370354 RepID=B0EDM3_ENTDS|nr:uncharacterized protein EDI_065090 [Entamoeba dispar SAW760]EDR27386.1 hypothetical protein EDI_065090 [Entamoeba dispar SAW760]|eukprot:EDR27386.1 hypothetical protein EDI_065090 [Entamoeba dispar SAW760]